jgi:hypothetical protein
MSYFPGMQKGNLDLVKDDEHGKIRKETVTLEDVSVTRVTFDVGAKWSSDLKHYGHIRGSSCRTHRGAWYPRTRSAAPSPAVSRAAGNPPMHRSRLS